FLHRQGDSSNLSFLVDYFRPDTDNQVRSDRKRLIIDVGVVDLSNISLRYLRGEPTPPAKGINYRDISLSELSGRFTDIDLNNHIFKSTIEGLTFREKSGFHLREMDAVAEIDSSYLELQDLYLETNRSRLGDYLRFEYPQFSAFEDFMESVTIKLTLNGARIDSKYIEFFQPEVAVTRFDVSLSGAFTGRVSDISARDVVLRMGNRTRLSGDFDIRGLPDIEHTVFDMRLHGLNTNRADIESLVGQL